MLLLGGARKDGRSWPESTASFVEATNVFKELVRHFAEAHPLLLYYC